MEFLKRLLFAALMVVGAALAQTQGGGGFNFEPTTIATQVMSYIGMVAAAGVAVLGLTIGISAAWRYAKKFLKG